MPMPTVRFRIDFGPNVSIGPGKIALLELIETTGSLSQAARELKMSWRRAWLLLDDPDHTLRERVVISNRGGPHGGGSKVTPFGRALIRAYRGFEETMQKQAVRRFDSFKRHPRNSLRKSSRIRKVTLSRRRQGMD